MQKSTPPRPRPRCRVCKQNVEFLKEKTKLIFEDCQISVLHKVTDVRFVLKDSSQSIIKLIDSCSSSVLFPPSERRKRNIFVSFDVIESKAVTEDSSSFANIFSSA